MKKLAFAAVLIAAAIAVSLSFGSSHREAPLTALDPTADDTDIYAFTAPDATDKLTVIANWIPFEDPAGGPNFYRFDDRAHYYINIDNTGDGVYDIRYQFAFKTHVLNKNSFLYALPGVSSISDPKLNVQQTYTVTREKLQEGQDRVREGDRAQRAGRAEQRRPEDDPRTTPPSPTRRSRRSAGGGKVFAGQRDDPFFVDLGTTFDAINLRMRHRQRRRRQGRPRRLRRALDRRSRCRSPR